MHILEPLLDFDARILCLSPQTPIPAVIDRLLRLHSAPEWQKPITLYLACADDANEHSQSALSALEFLQLHSILKILRSPIHATALGLLRGYEVLALASCTRGQRCLLPNAMACLGPLEIEDLPLSGTIGLGTNPGTSMRDQAKALVRAQLNYIIVDELKLCPSLWDTPRILTATGTVNEGIADAIVPIQNPHHKSESDTQIEVEESKTNEPQRQFRRDQH